MFDLLKEAEASVEKLDVDNEEFSEFDFAVAEANMEESEIQLNFEMAKEEQLQELEDLKVNLESAGEELALLRAAKPSLESMGVNCESNEQAVKDINTFIEKVEPSEENLSQWVALGVLVTVMLVEFLIYTYNVGVWLKKLVLKLSGKKLGDPNPKQYEDELKMIEYSKFNKVIDAITKSFDTLKQDSMRKKISSDTYKSIVSACKSAGIVFDENGKITKSSEDSLEPKLMSVKNAGWTKSNVDSTLDKLAKLSRILGDYADIHREVLRQKATIKAVKDSSEDKEKVKEAIKEQKRAAKLIRTSCKELASLIKMYSKKYKTAYYVFVN